MNLELLTVGMTLMVLGMGFVLAFLWLMIGAMHVMSYVVAYLNKIYPEKVVVVEKNRTAAVREDEAIAVAIAAVMAKK